MPHYFIDTSFFIAMANENDKYHKNAQKILTNLKSLDNVILTTSDYVIDEFLQILVKVENIDYAITWSYALIEKSFCNVYYCNHEIFNTALELFRTEKAERKPMSFTDCVVYVSHTLLQCDENLTFDNRLKNY